MPQKKHKPEEIVVKLRQVDVLVWQGQSVVEAVRSIGVIQFTYGAAPSRQGPRGATYQSLQPKGACLG